MKLSENAEKLYLPRGKVFELLSLYFSTQKTEYRELPVSSTTKKTRSQNQARQRVPALKTLDAAPSLKELAKTAGLMSINSRAGFKEIYGNTVFRLPAPTIRLDYAHEFARLAQIQG